MDEQNTNMEVVDDMTLEERNEHNKIKRAVSESLLEALEIDNIRKINNAEEITKMIITATSEGIRLAMADPEIHCRYQIKPEDHFAQHEALKGFMKLTEKINNITWKTLQSVVVFIVLGLFGLMLFGAAVKMKLFSILGIPS
jgi:uncharacterized protein (DUF2344 family)